MLSISQFVHMSVSVFVSSLLRYPLNAIFPHFLKSDVQNFHQLGPLGRVGLVVDMSVCVCVCLSVCPLPMRFFLRPLIRPQIT